MNGSSTILFNAKSRFQIAVASFLVGALCYLSARLADTLVLRPQTIWPLWPGCAFLVAVLLSTPRRIWPAFLVAGLAGFAIFDRSIGLSLASSFAFLLADAVEILIAALGVSLAFNGVPHLNSFKSLAKYCLFAVILAPISVASLAASTLGGGYRVAWRIGFLTEALALLTVTPAILGWVQTAHSRVKRRFTNYVEAVALFVGLTVSAYFTFVSLGSGSHPAFLYSLVPFLLWSALRFGITGISSAMIVVGVVSIWGTIHGSGPFIGGTRVDNVVSLQLFFLFAATSFMVLAALVEEYKATAQELRESEQRFRLAAQAGKMYSFDWDVVTDRVVRSPEHVGVLHVTDSLRYTSQEFIERIHPDDRSKFLAELTGLTPENSVDDVAYRVMLDEGAFVWLRSTRRAFFDRENRMVRLIGMVTDITSFKRAEEMLSAMSRKLLESQEQERVRIGRELHDDINQRLAMLAIGLEQLANNAPELPSRVQELRKELFQISNDVQALSHDLHSSKLEYLGVIAGIRSWCREFAERQKIEIDFRSDVRCPLPLDIGRPLFRILQEALHNASKHSGAKRIEVQLREEPGEINLVVTDSGKGFDIEEAFQGKGLGLSSMRERVRLINGSVAIDSKPTGGTTIHVRVPSSSSSASAEATG